MMITIDERTGHKIVHKAMLMAMKAHGTDLNKHDGELYLLHVGRVAARVVEKGHDAITIAIAWLHDADEDTDLTVLDILNAFRGFGMDIALEVSQGVRAMSKQPGQSNTEYYENLRTVPRAAAVKADGDIPDNFGRNHLIADDAKRLRMGKKYSEGMSILHRVG
jgi:(p)ppGpp synthase/HD superfamily hydrolase